MQIIIKSRQMQVTPQLRQKIERKLQRLARLVSDDARVEVTVAQEQTRSANDKYNVQLALSGGLQSQVSALNASAALDVALDKLVGQLNRSKDRAKRRQQASPVKVLSLARSGSLTSLEEESSFDVDENLLVEPEDNEAIWSQIKEIRRLPTQSMTDKEVIAQMEQDGEPFYPFFNAESNSVNVMYRLEDGGYGLLVPAQA
jgi:ribosomal subunit interface protein